MGVGSVEPAVVSRIGVSLYTAAADVSGARPAGPGLPVLEMATPWLFSSQLQCVVDVGNITKQEDDVRWRFLKQRPIRINGVSSPFTHPRSC